MTITEFLATAGFKPHGTVVNPWDSFNAAGTVVPRRHQLCDDVRELERRPGRSSAFPAKPVRPVGAYRRR